MQTTQWIGKLGVLKDAFHHPDDSWDSAESTGVPKPQVGLSGTLGEGHAREVQHNVSSGMKFRAKGLRA